MQNVIHLYTIIDYFVSKYDIVEAEKNTIKVAKKSGRHGRGISQKHVWVFQAKRCHIYSGAERGFFQKAAGKRPGVQANRSGINCYSARMRRLPRMSGTPLQTYLEHAVSIDDRPLS